MSIKEASAAIKKFEQDEFLHYPELDIKHLAIGQKFSLALVKEFIAAIERHPQAANIDAIRIYLAKSAREAGGEVLHDVVLVPVLKDSGIDLHKVYDRESLAGQQDTILGEGLPCPNVCPGTGFFC